MSRMNIGTPVGNLDIKSKRARIESNFLNHRYLKGQHVAFYCVFRLTAKDITYILAIARWPLLAKQGPLNMIKTDYGVVFTSKEPRPIITPAFQHDSPPALFPQMQKGKEKTEPGLL